MERKGNSHTSETRCKDLPVLSRRLKMGWYAYVPLWEVRGFYVLPTWEAQLRATYLLKWNNSSYYNNYKKNAVG